MTDTIDVAALVERLRAGIRYLPRDATVGSKAPVEFDSFGDSILVNEGDFWLATIFMPQAATVLQSQADALAEARRERDAAVRHATKLLQTAKEDFELMKETADTVQSLSARATTAETALATMREALEEWRAARIATLAEPVADVRKSETFAKALNRLAEAEDGLVRALGGSNAE